MYFGKIQKISQVMISLNPSSDCRTDSNVICVHGAFFSSCFSRQNHRLVKIGLIANLRALCQQILQQLYSLNNKALTTNFDRINGFYLFHHSYRKNCPNDV